MPNFVDIEMPFPTNSKFNYYCKICWLWPWRHSSLSIHWFYVELIVMGVAWGQGMLNPHLVPFHLGFAVVLLVFPNLSWIFHFSTSNFPPYFIDFAFFDTINDIYVKHGLLVDINEFSLTKILWSWCSASVNIHWFCVKLNFFDTIKFILAANW